MTFKPDWDELQACRDSLREHMAMNARLKATIQKALNDSESGTGWGPDVTVRAYLIDALEGNEK